MCQTVSKRIVCVLSHLLLKQSLQVVSKLVLQERYHCLGSETICLKPQTFQQYQWQQ